jgi:hypothetical protein
MVKLKLFTVRKGEHAMSASLKSVSETYIFNLIKSDTEKIVDSPIDHPSINFSDVASSHLIDERHQPFEALVSCCR